MLPVICRIHHHLNNVSEATLPEVDADFAKALGIEDGDVAKMREEVKKTLVAKLSAASVNKPKNL